MNRVVFLIGCVLWACFMGCRQSRTDKETAALSLQAEKDTVVSVSAESECVKPKVFTAGDILLTKDFLYDKYTLEDTYPYKELPRGRTCVCVMLRHMLSLFLIGRLSYSL